ncbi:unnamed protein product [Chrysoparadoxa australica]
MLNPRFASLCRRGGVSRALRSHSLHSWRGGAVKAGPMIKTCSDQREWVRAGQVRCMGGGPGAPPPNSGGKNEETEPKEREEDMRDEEEYVGEPLSLFQKVSWSALGILFFGCLWQVVRVLNPFGDSATAITNRAYDALMADPDIVNHFGSGVKQYGRDSGGKREGRRNTVDCVEYTSPDNSDDKRTRVRFHIEGEGGMTKGLVYAEVSSIKSPDYDWVYLMVQDLRTGHVITLHDNRALIASQGGM